MSCLPTHAFRHGMRICVLALMAGTAFGSSLGEEGSDTVMLSKDTSISPAQRVTITPMAQHVMAGQPVLFSASGASSGVTELRWDFGDGMRASGRQVRHTYKAAGVYRVALTAVEGTAAAKNLALVRVHTEETLSVPQVLLDTDAMNEQDDQHYLGYALFGELTLLGINSTHHGGGQEPVNYAEILNILSLSRESGLPESRVPFLFRGADKRLQPPKSLVWHDTEPVVTDASEAILAAARGAAPGKPVWIVPVGPGTNPASAALQARREGFDLRGRVRFLWLGGSDTAVIGEFNGNNDPWSLYVLAQCGVETWIVPAPVGARVAVNKEREGDLYADHALGRYLKRIIPMGNKPLFDPATLSVIISEALDLKWVKNAEPVGIAGPENGYRWIPADSESVVRVIRTIDETAMKRDLFETLKGRPIRLHGVSAKP